MAWDYVTITRQGRVAVVRFDRGDGLNPMSIKLNRELTEAAQSLADDLEISAVVLTGGARGFCAGRDLRDPETAERAHKPMLERRQLMALGPRLCAAWENLEQFTVAAIEGFAVGAGFALALACDYRVMGAGAHFRAPEIALGLSMSWGTVPRLVSLVGPARAKQALIFADDRIGSGDALSWGLVQEAVPDGGTVERALQLAEKAAAMPPVPVRMTKQAVNAYANALAYATTFMDFDQNALTQTTADHVEAVAAFKEKRKPTFTGG